VGRLEGRGAAGLKDVVAEVRAKFPKVTSEKMLYFGRKYSRK